MKRAICFLILWALAGPAAAQPYRGVYLWEAFGQRESVTLESDRVLWDIRGAGLPEEGVQEETPVARWESSRAVLGPMTDTMLPYQVLFVLAQDADGLLLYRDGRQYETVEDALAAVPGEGKPYYSQERYQQLQALPTLAEPTREQLQGWLEKAVARAGGKPQSFLAMDHLFRRLLIEEGYNPFSSEEVFVKARMRYESDPSIQALLRQLQDDEPEE